MLIFRGEDHIDRWCAARDLSRGATLSPDTAWRLARAWYQHKAQPSWRRHTLDEAEQLFEELGLTDDFWGLR